MSGERKKLISATVQISRTLILSLTGMFVVAGIKWPLNDIIKCELEGSDVNWVAFSSLALTGQVVILELSVHLLHIKQRLTLSALTSVVGVPSLSTISSPLRPAFGSKAIASFKDVTIY